METHQQSIIMKRRRALSFLCVLLALVCPSAVVKAHEERVVAPTESTIVIPMPTPGPRGVKHNDYMCTAASVPAQDLFITRFEPRANPNVAHHMLIFGCSDTASLQSWSCKNNGLICESEPHIIFAWALNASGLHLPQDVGVKIGPSVGINSIVVQIHYGYPENHPDLVASSKEAMVLHTTQQRQPYIAGIYLIGSGSTIHSGTERSLVDSACNFRGPKTIYPFAFRTHAHHLGEQIAGYVIKSGQWELIGTRSPQDPQAFYPAANMVEVDIGDTLAMRCVFNMEGKTHSVHMGADSEDEMCNFYIMYYTRNDGQTLYSESCWQPATRSLVYPELPSLTTPTVTPTTEPIVMTDVVSESTEEEDNYECPKAIPPNGSGSSRCINATTTTTTSPIPVLPTAIPNIGSETTESNPHTSHNPFFEGADNTGSKPLGMVPAEDWTLNGIDIPGMTLGQVSAVAVDKNGFVHILHRGPVVWDYRSFNFDYTYRHQGDGPIKVPVLLMFTTVGVPQRAWAESIFYMPHGLTIDHEGNFWVTDVALHQVFKFTKLGSSEPSMILGTEFKPGSGFGHFCQPASVAVETSGNFYIADGYCNRRILKFSGSGQLLETWQDPISHLSLFVPHKLTLSAAEDKLFVADRENSRVIAYDMQTGRGEVFSGAAVLGGKPFAISTNGSRDWPMHGVFGSGKHGVVGFSLDSSGKIINTWGPEGGFDQPHDLTVDPINNAVYVTEIGPNRIWKFVSIDLSPQVDVTDLLDSHLSQPDSEPHAPPAPAGNSGNTGGGKDHSESEDSQHNFNIDNHLSTPLSLPITPPSSDGGTPVHGVLPDTPLKGPKPIDDNHNNHIGGTAGTTEECKNHSVNIESSPKGGATPNGKSSQMISKVNLGAIIAAFVLATVFVLILIGVLKEHKYLRFRGAVCLRRGRVAVESNGKINRSAKKRSSPKNKLHSLLGPSKLGFSRLRTYDSDSEEEEFPVFNRV